MMMRRGTKIIVTTRQHDALIATLRQAFPSGKTAYELAIAHPDIPLDVILSWLRPERGVRRRWLDGNYYMIPDTVRVRLTLWNMLFMASGAELFGGMGRADIAAALVIACGILHMLEFWPW
ncbi:MAG: hypothetical protein ACYCUY_00110 [Acidithiobacillus sp.]